MNFSEAFAQAMAGGTVDDGRDLTPEQQVIRLREVTALRAETHTFKPGQIVVHKYTELAEIKDADQPRIFIKYLDKPIRAADMMDFDGLRTSVATHEYDCMFGLITDGLTYTEYFADSRWLKPHPDFTEE